MPQVKRLTRRVRLPSYELPFHSTAPSLVERATDGVDEGREIAPLAFQSSSGVHI